MHSDEIVGITDKENLMRIVNSIIALIAVVLLVSCATPKKSVTEDQARVDYDLLINLPEEPISYSDQIRPILDRRCVSAKLDVTPDD